jgi:hypothetical protein
LDLRQYTYKNRHKCNYSIGVGPEAVQVKGMVSNTRWGRQVIYQRRLVWNGMDKNYGVTKGNERSMGVQWTARQITSRRWDL